jgi:hypothetical protein
MMIIPRLKEGQHVKIVLKGSGSKLYAVVDPLTLKALDSMTDGTSPTVVTDMFNTAGVPVPFASDSQQFKSILVDPGEIAAILCEEELSEDDC